MLATALRNGSRIVIVGLILGIAYASAQADPGTCKRKRQPPNQSLFWVCVNEGSSCASGTTCQTISYSGFVPFKSCECLPSVPDPDDFSYGTGGIWNTRVVSGTPGPNATVTFELVAGPNQFVVYPNAGIDNGQVQDAQVFTGSDDLAGTFTVQLAAGPADSIPAHVTALALTMTSFSFEGAPTGSNKIQLAQDGGTATGHYLAATHTLQFDAPVHCSIVSELVGPGDFYFRPILTEAQETAKPGSRSASSPFELFATGRYEPSETVPVKRYEWGSLKTLFR